MNRRHLGFVIVAFYLAAGTMLATFIVQTIHARFRPKSLGAHGGVAAVSQAAPKYLVLFVLDGARPDYFGLTPLPHVDALRHAGVQYTNGIDGILEAETPAGHATIASGSRPDRNGILGFDWANDSNRTSLFAPEKMGSLLQDLGNSGVPTLASAYKEQFPGARVVALSGHKYYAAAPLGGPAADAIMYFQGDASGHYVPVAVPGHVPPAGVLDAPGVTFPVIHLKNGQEDGLATNLALAAVRVMKPRMLLINYPEFDWPLGHVDGGNLAPHSVITDMKNFDQDLGRIEAAYSAAGILDQTLFVITADHGMMPITRFVPSTIITNAVTAAGTTAPDIASCSADYVWLADITKAGNVAQNIMSVNDPGIQSVYYLSYTGGTTHYVAADGNSVAPALQSAHQYLLSALLNGHQPSVVVFGAEGASFSDPKTGWKADHGGPTWASQHMPLILSGSGIRRGVTITHAAQLEDVAPTVLAAMGVEPLGMDGTILSDALAKPSPSQQQLRSAEIGWLSPLAAALEKDSAQPVSR